MALYIILSRVSPHAFDDPADFKKMAETVSEKIKTQCPDVKWKESFVTLGQYDVVDIVESENPDQVGRAAMLIRAYGRSVTETMPANDWKSFLKTL
jgi:uncharacterized protein with GYD domain